ncbi:MAG: hypothetical protein NVSMB64_21760 [Candidatus Velthaea sp.]
MFAGSEKLGQPLPLSNFVADEKSVMPHAPHSYVPAALFAYSAPVNGRSVADSRSTAYWSGESSLRHCAAVFSIFVLTWGKNRDR